MKQQTKFKDTEMGKIPSDWDVKKLNKLTSKIGSGATPRGGEKAYCSKGISLIRSQNVFNNGFINVFTRWNSW